MTLLVSLMISSRHEPRYRWLQQHLTALAQRNSSCAPRFGPSADAKHFPIMPSADEVADGRLAYLRPHGRDAEASLTGKAVAERFYHDYSDAEIVEVSETVLHLAEQSDAVHVVFNNNRRDFAPVVAGRLRRKLGQGNTRLEPSRKQGTLL